jgi:hypothetical protein
MNSRTSEGDFSFEDRFELEKHLGVCVAGGIQPVLGLRAHTNPLNRDPLVREAYIRFYNLDYPGAVERFERFQAAIPAIPRPPRCCLTPFSFRSSTGSTCWTPPSTPTTAS